MFRDPIVDEVRRAREKEAAKHGLDVRAILAAAKKRQRRSGHRVVSFVRNSRKSTAQPRAAPVVALKQRM